MYVGINFNPPAGTGVQRYSRNLLLALGTLAQTEPGLRLTAFAFGKRDPRPAWLPPAISYQSTRVPGRVQRLLHRRLQVPVEWLFQARGLDLLHTAAMELLHTRLPCVMTVFDVAWRHVGPAYHTVVSAQWIEQAESMILRSQQICAISATTAADLVAGGIPPERVTVTPLGVEARFRSIPTEAVAGVRTRYQLPEGLLLYVGAINVRKNIGVVVRALAAMPRPPVLVIVGPPPPEGLTHWGLTGVDARHLGYVADADLPALYASAGALVVPSLAEGFGLPLLEAMAAGTPVIASDIPVFREIGGEAPSYFAPQDEERLRQAIEEALQDPGARARRAAAGRLRSEGFTWEACATATVRAYRAALGQR